VASMETNHAQTQMQTLQTRMRFIRESQHLTLLQASRLSKGEISAIALGSYERGDRSVSARKLIQIASLYQVPVSELFEPTKTQLIERCVSIDLRKLMNTSDPNARELMGYIRNIVRMRGDWNGEIISLRSQDLTNMEIFTEIPPETIQEMLLTYGFPRSK
jgi:transcriptional regulator with XRE-family HTH domain